MQTRPRTPLALDGIAATRMPALGRVVLVTLATVGVVSVAIVAIARPEGIVASVDPGSPAVPLWTRLLPAVAAIALALALPPGRRVQPVEVGDPARHALTTWLLLGLAVLFPLVVGVAGLASTLWYPLVKVALLVVVPATLVGVLRGAIRIHRLGGAWRWWAPALAIGAWALLEKVAPWNPPTDLSGIDPVHLAVAASITALTAGVGEELFHRRWLQSRLEAALGPAAGIALASFAFACMHLGSHGGEGPIVDLATVVALQGSFGLLAAVLWWRYRNLTAIVVLHVLSNGWEVVPALLT